MSRPARASRLDSATRLIPAPDGATRVAVGVQERRRTDRRESARSVRLFSRKRGVSGATRQIATLLAAGFTLDRALEITANLEAEPLASVLEDVRSSVREGKSLSAALSEHPSTFSAFYRGVAEAGERSGALAATFERLAGDLERDAELRSQLVGSLIYPAIMVCAGSLAVLVLLGWVIPRFATILSELGGDLPWTARVLVELGGIIGESSWLALLLGSVGSVLVLAHRRTLKGRLLQDRWLLRVPILGPLRARLATERWTRALGGALGTGIPLLTGLEIAADAAVDAAFGDELGRAAEAVRRGESLSGAFRNGGVVPELAVRMIAAGEESGRLAKMLSHVAEAYRRQTERRLRTLVSLVEPAVIVVFGAVVGFVALALLQTVYGLGSAF